MNPSTNMNVELAFKPFPQIKLSVYQQGVFILSFFYAFILSSLPLTVFKDRDNYLVYAEYSHDIILRYLDAGFLTLLSNEPIWLLLNIGLRLFLSAENALRILIFVPAFLVSYYVLRSEPRHFIWLLFILFIPNVIKNHIIHLRQGVAIAFFLAAWFCKKKALRVVLFAIPPFIHASFFFVLGLFLLTKFMIRCRWSSGIRILGIVFCSIATVVSLQWIVSMLGARQAEEYQFVGGEISGLGFLFWGVILLIFCLQGKTFLRKHAFETGTIVYYLGTYFFLEITARIFESTLLLVLLAGLNLTGWRRLLYYVMLLFFAIYSYYSRIGQPWLGWGLSM